MKIASVDEMRELERRTNEIYGDESIMMEHAAFSIYLAIEEEIGTFEGKRALIFVGKGNNGGDAMALARNLHESGMDVKVCTVFGNVSSPLAVKNLSILKRMGIPVVDSIGKDEIRSADIVIDGIFGIGLKSKINGRVSEIIDMINSNSKFTVSVDIPSGVDADNGNVDGKAVVANMTVTLGMIKRGMLFYPARSLCGKIKVGKIGIPPEIIEDQNLKGEVTTFLDAKSLLPFRPPFSNKGTFGKVLIISGSKNYTGTPSMVALGALRSGAGLVRIASTSISSFLPEAISIPLEMEDSEISLKNLPLIDDLAGKSDVIAIGPGMGTGKNATGIMSHLLTRWKDKITVIDADGINVLSKIDYEFSPNTLITPHPGEFARLTSKSIDEVLSDPLMHAVRFANEKHVLTLLKGPTTVISRPDGRYAINITGNSALAKGGSGDVLTGMIAGFAAQGMDLFNAAKLSAYIHGRTAELYAQGKGEYSMIAREIGDLIPQIIKELIQ
ncbi:MAG: bifunctional ADP-dependent NAD(P)H-hydrate dehydratase/NAD(P)H-hydrate epimerase [Mesoaciditoga sp.]|uniref:NAD(P)H-hydrate dehydratase n=1 Tax=Athalassotoga sp. TaxID=2022597 RepID=UPI000CB8C693|nr:MAG: bifunctional ADP-dependent NAD(P)H-hydrate dehydratase/NAD(P)H-hydrate epimerase [Mesoaciditoga sp.]HEU24528.1 NAD(P)H-hydrate dehydratase [Mesoaciditoga lauensis]